MLACVVLLAAAWSRAESAQPTRVADGLFSPPASSPDSAFDQTGVVPDGPRWRRVRVDTDRLADDRLSLNLFNDLKLDAGRTGAAEMSAGGTEAWMGVVDGEPLSAVTFVRDGDIVQGSIRSAAGAFVIEPLVNGPDHIVRQIDPTRFGPELVPLAPPALPPPGAPLDQAAPTGQDDGRTIDLLAVYTAGARQQAGGSDAAVRARIALGVAETNTAYANSGVTQRIRLVGAELIGYHERGDLSLDLERLTQPADGEMDLVHARRLTRLYGTRARVLLGLARSQADLGQHFGGDLFEAEVRYLMQHEWATTAEDVLWRRTKRGLRMSKEQAAALDRYIGAARDSLVAAE